MGPCLPKALLLTHKSSLYYSKVLLGHQDIFGKHKTSLAVLKSKIKNMFSWRRLTGLFKISVIIHKIIPEVDTDNHQKQTDAINLFLRSLWLLSSNQIQTARPVILNMTGVHVSVWQVKLDPNTSSYCACKLASARNPTCNTSVMLF